MLQPQVNSAFRSSIAYLLPFALFLLITNIEPQFSLTIYPAIYTFKIVVVGAAIFTLRKSYPEVTPDLKLVPFAIGLGIVLCALWIGVDKITPHIGFLGKRIGYDPKSYLHNPLWKNIFVGVRLGGLIVIAPITEELIYRSFLPRILANTNDFRTVPIGVFDSISFGLIVVLMALAHPEWLAAALFSATLNLLVIKTKSVFAAIVCHGATNLALGVYVLITHSWSYW